MAAGRPNMYNDDLADKVCEIISTTSQSLHKISAMEGMPGVTTMLRWLRDKEEFRLQYARAKEAQADFLAQEIIDISDDSSGDEKFTEFGIKENTEFVNRSKLRVDSRKWLAGKLSPKKYGDKVDVTSLGEKIEGTVFIWGGKEIKT